MQKILVNMVRIYLAAAALGLFLTGTASAEAQTQKSPFGIQVPLQAQGSITTAPLSTPTDTGIVNRGWNWLLVTQSALNKEMAVSVRNLHSENPVQATLFLIAIAFAYGVLHAAGPGHGKSVISSYVLSNKETVRRGIALSFLSALFQAVSAILFVGILSIILRQTSLQMRSTEASIETISWGLVAAVGAFLLWRQISPLLGETNGASALHDHADRRHDDHNHGPNCSCGHSHMPAPKDLQGAWSWKKALPLALSVGIRPCSGAILLLIFALSQGMFWAGVLGTFAMAFGTAITVSVLATFAVTSREWATRASGPGSLWAERIQTVIGIAGAGLVFGLGTAFFLASLHGGSPL